MYLSIALLSPPFSTLTYAAPPYLPETFFAPGTRVLVPLGHSMVRLGLVLDTDVPAPAASVAVRCALWPMERQPLCDDDYLCMIRELAGRSMVTPGEILGTVLPAGLRGLHTRLRILKDGARPESVSPRALLERDAVSLNGLARTWLAGEADWLAPRADAAATEACVLLRDPPWPIRPAAHKQRAVLEWLYAHEISPRRELLRAVPDAQAALTALIRAGLVVIRPLAFMDEEESCPDLLPPPDASFPLSARQLAVVDSLTAALDKGKAAAHLVYGVTGSGKTRVYLEAVKACLARGRTAFLLAPEVALALKLRRDVEREIEGAPLFFFHGYQSASRREQTFVEMARRKVPCVVVGTRSALFLPVRRPGLIVLDEEHDSSFKQDEGLIYHAKEVAWFRAKQVEGVLVLGSATPDIKTFYAAKSGHMAFSSLPERVGGGTLPTVRLVNIRDLELTESLLAPESLAALTAAVKAGNQAVILLNLRGYAPRMFCSECGKVVRCPHCDIGLTYHKGRERLVCHYCGYSLPFPCLCPTCRSSHFVPMGQGTERIEEYLTSVLPPGCGVLRLDRDSTRRPGRMEEILEAFAARKAQVLVGTQMLSKGHHFPHVTLALVADGDLGLNTPDYRACERTFQLLLQSAGRAGRGETPGEVIIQTRDPNHYCWQYVRNGDYEGFYANELARRERRRYPPFTRLALIRMSYPMEWEQAQAELARLTTVLREAGRAQEVAVLGPAPAPHEFLRGRKRVRCMLKAPDWGKIRAVYAALLAAKPHASLRVALDLDPVNML